MATEEQNVYITGSSLADWSTEATQAQISGSLKQIQADGNAMIRVLTSIANGTKISSKELKKASDSVRAGNRNQQVNNKKEQTRDNRIVNSQQKIASSGKATMSILTGMRSDILDVERRTKKRDEYFGSLQKQGFTDEAAGIAADRKIQMDLYSRLGTVIVGFAAGTEGILNAATGGIQQGYNERFAMVAEMRQAGLLGNMEKTEAGFIEMSKVISATNFTFGEASEFTKEFARAVGVMGVKAALDFSNSIADESGSDFMRKYALEFGQVANIAGEYIDSLRIGGQLSTISERDMKTGMNDFMGGVEMTSNVLKISMEEAASLMKKAIQPGDVALLAMLPEEQRKAIEAGFKSVNAQGNPMSETLSMRLAAGSRGAFLQTAEYQEMAQTAPGREVLNFVEQMANTLETGSNEDFQSALAEGFPALADSLIAMTKGTGVGVQLLNNPGMRGMIGSIIEASQNYGDADKGTSKGADNDAEQEQVARMIQVREALVLSESALNGHMENFIDNMREITESQRALATEMAIMLSTMAPLTGVATDVSTFFTTLKNTAFEKIAGAMTFGEMPADLQETMTNQNALAPADSLLTFGSRSGDLDSEIDTAMGRLKDQMNEITNNKDMVKETKIAEYTELIKLLQAQSNNTMAILSRNKVAIANDDSEGGLNETWTDNYAELQSYAAELNKLVTELRGK
jgi:hypothetical protein